MSTITTSFHTVGGDVLGETSSLASVSTIYLSDEMGNVSDAVTATAPPQTVLSKRYSAFGLLKSESEPATTSIRFNWLGARSCYSTNLAFATFYYERDHFSLESSRWSAFGHYNTSGKSYSFSLASQFAPRDTPCDLALFDPKDSFCVSSIQVNQPSKELCGSWGSIQSWDVKWDIAALRRLHNDNGTPMTSNGIIIQEIYFNPVNVTVCKGYSFTHKPYWEGWWLNGNNTQYGDPAFNVYPNYHEDDSWRDPTTYPCGIGTKKEEGWVKFYPVSFSCMAQWRWSEGVTTDFRGHLVGGGSPQNWSRVNSNHRSQTATFTCCEGSICAPFQCIYVATSLTTEPGKC